MTSILETYTRLDVHQENFVTEITQGNNPVREALYLYLNKDIPSNYSYAVGFNELTWDDLEKFITLIKNELKVEDEDIYLTNYAENATQGDRIDKTSIEVEREVPQGAQSGSVETSTDCQPRAQLPKTTVGYGGAEIKSDEHGNTYEYGRMIYLLMVRRNFIVKIYLTSVDVAYDKNDREVCELMEKFKLLIRDFYKPAEEIPNLALLCQTHTGLEISYFPVKKYNVDIKKYYNDDFGQADTAITDFFKDTESSGLVLLHGKAGTGKTTYIRHLLQLLASKYTVIYLPNELIHIIADPVFVPFIRRYSNSVIVLEDAEKVIQKRTLQDNDGRGVSNILNLTDGLLSDCLKLKIICTFNCEVNEIDPALLRKGRLVCDYEFQPLTTEKARVIYQELGKMEEFEKVSHQDGFTLAEIFNAGKENRFGIEKKEKVSGFGIPKGEIKK